MFNNKKAQISDTMTWLVATLVIVVVLGISIAFTASFSDSKLIFLDDKERDFIATKSITNFLKNEDENKIESKMKIFLEEISSGETVNPGGWNLELERNGEEINVDTLRVLDFRDREFIIKRNLNEMKFFFWKDCHAGCVR